MATLRSVTWLGLCLLLSFACGGGSDNDSNDGAGGTSSGQGGSGGTGTPCQLGCMATIAAQCSSGPTEQTACEADCEALRVGSCATQYIIYLNCSVGETIVCSDTGVPVVPSCTMEQTAYYDCMN
jgi:hypothetical protein